jgi:hypothetical protein
VFKFQWLRVLVFRIRVELRVCYCVFWVEFLEVFSGDPFSSLEQKFRLGSKGNSGLPTPKNYENSLISVDFRILGPNKSWRRGNSPLRNLYEVSRRSCSG